MADDTIIGFLVIFLFVMAIYCLPSVIISIIFYSTIITWALEIASIGGVLAYLLLKGKKTKKK